MHQIGIPNEIDQPARGGHQNLHLMAELGFLRLHIDAAEEGKGDHLGVLRNAIHFFHILQGQLTGGHQYQCLDGIQGRIRLLDERNPAGPGFA